MDVCHVLCFVFLVCLFEVLAVAAALVVVCVCFCVCFNSLGHTLEPAQIGALRTMKPNRKRHERIQRWIFNSFIHTFIWCCDAVYDQPKRQTKIKWCKSIWIENTHDVRNSITAALMPTPPSAPFSKYSIEKSILHNRKCAASKYYQKKHITFISLHMHLSFYSFHFHSMLQVAFCSAK